MRKSLIIMALACAVLACGCAADIGTDEYRAPGISTIASAYVGLEGIKPYDGNIIHIGLWDMDERPGEIASFDLWPLFGVGIGIVGVRAHVLPVDAGVGAIWYQPVPVYKEVTEAEDVHY